MRDPTKRMAGGFTLFELVVVVAVVAILVGMILLAGPRPSRDIRHIKCSSNLKQIAIAFRGFAQDWDGAYPFEAKNLTNHVGAPDGGTQVASNTTPSDLWMQFQMLSNELNTAKVLICPSDVARLKVMAEDFSDHEAPRGFAHPSARNQSLSFFLGINANESKPGMFLAGDRCLAPSSKQFPYSSLRQGGPVPVRSTSCRSELSGYQQHGERINIAFPDGSVRQLKDAELQESLRAAAVNYGVGANLILFPQ